MAKIIGLRTLNSEDMVKPVVLFWVVLWRATAGCWSRAVVERCRICVSFLSFRVEASLRNPSGFWDQEDSPALAWVFGYLLVYSEAVSMCKFVLAGDIFALVALGDICGKPSLTALSSRVGAPFARCDGIPDVAECNSSLHIVLGGAR